MYHPYFIYLTNYLLGIIIVPSSTGYYRFFVHHANLSVLETPFHFCQLFISLFFRLSNFTNNYLEYIKIE